MLTSRESVSLQAMTVAHKSLNVQTYGVPQVATSSILVIEPVEEALNKAAAVERQSPGSCKEVLKAYAALAIMRQAAQALTQYGIRYAHLYMRHSLDALPILKR